jgi:hypothetical protein
MMNLNSPLFDKIRSKPVAEEARPAVEPACQHPGCARKGEFRAPMGRDHEGQFFQFCLEHVKAYNQSYNYFDGMSDDAVQNFQKDALTGHRPTWTAGVNGTVAPDSKLDAATLLRARLERLRRARDAAEKASERRSVGKAARKALETLGLDVDADKDSVRKRFKELAKRLHPDLNEGDRSREDKLRAIIDAYNYLKTVGLA